MAARRRMEAVKTAVLSLLLDAYQRRDKVGLVTFRGADATLALPPTSSVEVAARRLAELPSGGRTPLAEGLLCAAETLRVEGIRDPRRRPLLVVVTDGRATSGNRRPAPQRTRRRPPAETSESPRWSSTARAAGSASDWRDRLAHRMGADCLSVAEVERRALLTGAALRHVQDAA